MYFILVIKYFSAFGKKECYEDVEVAPTFPLCIASLENNYYQQQTELF